VRSPEEIVYEDFSYLPESVRKDIASTYPEWLEGVMNRELLAYKAAGAVGRARNAFGRIIEGGRRRKNYTRRNKTKRTRKH